MNAHETEIRRHANGSIDIDHYVRCCHRNRSLAAHQATGRIAAFARTLVGRLFSRGRRTAIEDNPLSSRDGRSATTRKQTLRRAA